MADTNTAGIPEFARLLSLEPFPLKPMLDEKQIAKSYNNLRKFNEELERYLKRLTTKFSEFGNQLNQYITNVVNNVATGSGFVKVVEKSYHYHGTDDTVITLDNTIDWREVGIISHCRISEDGGGWSDVLHNIDDPAWAVQQRQGSNATGDYPSILASAHNSANDFSLSCYVQSDGSLTLELINGKPGSMNVYFYVYIAAYSQVVPDGSQTSIGNGL